MIPVRLTFGVVALVLSVTPQSTEAQEVLDSNALGPIRACTRLSAVRTTFPSAKDTMIVGEADSHWPAKIVHLDATTWVIVESSWADTGHIWTIRTNSPRFHTRAGYHVGTRVRELLDHKERLTAEIGEGQLGLAIVREGIGFGIDRKSTDAFFRVYKPGDDPAPLLDPGATITSLAAGGDCR